MLSGRTKENPSNMAQDAGQVRAQTFPYLIHKERTSVFGPSSYLHILIRNYRQARALLTSCVLFVLQFLIALLAGVGAFTVLHILGFGLIYKVVPPVHSPLQQFAQGPDWEFQSMK